MVWSTTQSARYETESRAAQPEKDKGEALPKRPPKERQKDLLEDGDMLLMLALIMILSREKADRTLIFALLIALMM